MHSDRWRNARPAIVSALAALIVYAITLGGTFVYDDFSIFTTDARLHDVSRWGEFWTDSYNGGIDNLYRPLVSMTYAIQWLIHGDAIAWPFHLVNWLLHAAVCAALAEFARRLIVAHEPWRGKDRASNIALVAGLLFAVHPIHVEAAANIVGRAELMCALGFLSAMMLFLRRPMTIARSMAIFGCFILSLLSKEQGMLLPLMLLILGLAVGIRPVDRRERNALLTLTIVLCLSLAGYIVLRERILKFWWDRSFLDWTINPLVRSGAVDRWLVPFSILGRYATLLVFPLHLSPDYGANVIGSTARWNEPYIYIGFAAVIGWGVACVFAFVKRNAALIVALLGLAITYGVVSNFITLIGTNFGERLMYLPSAFFVILIALALARLPRRTSVVIASILILAGAVQSFAYARRWNDRLSFYAWAARERPAAIRLRMLLMSELKAQGRLDDAAAEGDRARAMLPEYDEIWLHSADIAIERGRFDEAKQFAEHAMHLRPSIKAASWMNKVDRVRAEAATKPSTNPATKPGTNSATP